MAALARLRLPEAELSRWTEQLSRIVGYIEQLKQIPEEAWAASRGAAPRSAPARDDTPRDGRGSEALASNSPKLMHGYGAVPRVVGSGS